MNGTISHLHRDHLGSVRYISNSAGERGRETSYSSFGLPVYERIRDANLSPESKGYIG